MKKLLYIFLFISTFLYGILVGKYEWFPFDVFKKLQDWYEGPGDEANRIFGKPDVRSLITVNESNADSMYALLVSEVFGVDSLPANLPDSVFAVDDPEYAGLENLKNTQQFVVKMDHGIISTGYIFHPDKSNNRLMIYNQGHSGDFVFGKKTIEFFVRNGFTVYAFCMPLLGKNNTPNIFLDKLGETRMADHDRFRYLKNPHRFFIQPIVTMINYAVTQNYTDISMTGVSGGGWTTTLSAAADKRIQYAFPVAGSLPFFITFRKKDIAYGDFEQVDEDLYSKINYLDIYILGSIGENRKHVQILNKYDPACFDGEEYKEYDTIIGNIVTGFGEGSFRVFSDSTHREHKISDEALKEMLKSLTE
jgi:hypothetical protein